MAQTIASIALAALGLSGDPVHEPVHAQAFAPHLVTALGNVAEVRARQPGSVPRLADYESSMPAGPDRDIYLRKCETAVAANRDLAPHLP
jgi:hypothetical protein